MSDSKDLTQKIMNLLNDAERFGICIVDRIGALNTAKLLQDNAFLKAQEPPKKKPSYVIKNRKKIITK